jgi:hypothetical protein
MIKEVAVRRLLIGAGCAVLLAGCGSSEREAGSPPAAARATAPPAATPDAAARHGRKVIVFRRVRYEGATLNVMTLYADGFVKIDVPNGGAGGAAFVSRATPRALRGVRRAIAETPWRHLSKRKVLFDRSGAYFMLHHRGEDYIAMADGMSADLKPIVTRLNAILVGDGRGERHTVHRWGRI